MTGHDDDPTIRERVQTIASEVISGVRLAPYVLRAEVGPALVQIDVCDRRLRLSGAATLDYAYLTSCEDDEIRREIGRTIGRAISRSLEREE